MEVLRIKYLFIVIVQCPQDEELPWRNVFPIITSQITDPEPGVKDKAVLIVDQHPVTFHKYAVYGVVMVNLDRLTVAIPE